MDSIRARREAVVKAHIEAKAVNHDVASTVVTFAHPRYEVPALGVTAEGPQAVEGLVGGLLIGIPRFYLHPQVFHHAENAVIVEVCFGGTQRGIWAGVEPTGRPMEVHGRGMHRRTVNHLRW
jgi:hypothetical protein